MGWLRVFGGFSLCKVLGVGVEKQGFFFLFICLMNQVTREIGRNTHFIPHLINKDQEKQNLFGSSLSQFPLLSFCGNNYHSGQQLVYLLL